MFLGFAAGYKGVIYYDISTRKLVLSRHVIHDESVFPFKLNSRNHSGNLVGSQNSHSSLVVIQLPIFKTNDQFILSSSNEV